MECCGDCKALSLCLGNHVFLSVTVVLCGVASC